MRSGAVSSKFICSQMRLDGKFHLSEGLSVRKGVEKSPYGVVPIADVTSDVYCPGIFRRNYVNDGIPFLGGGDIQKQILDSGKYLRKSTTPNYEILQVKYGWTLVTCGGTIGDAVFSSNLHAKCWISQHVMRVIPNSKIRQGMLYAYLASKYGKLLLTTDTYGSVIPTLNATSIKSIPIPSFPESFQDRVNALVQESASLKEESVEALCEAHSLIEGHFDLEASLEKTGTVSSKTILGSPLHRFEATYHLALGKQYDEYIKRHFEWKPLGDVSLSISRPGIAKRMYVKDGITFLGGTDLFLSIPDSDKKLSKKAPNLDEYLIQEGWILLPRSGTIGDVVFTNEQHAQKLVSEDVVRIIPNNILRRGFVFSFLSSKIGKALIQRPIFGSVIQHVEPPLLSVIPIPVFEEDEMEKIASLAEKHRECWGKAAKMELEAISLVEKEIEKWNN